MNFQADNDRVFIRPIIEEDTLTPAGVIVPHLEDKRNPPTTGIVLSCGPGKEKEPLTLNIGDKVSFRKGAGLKAYFNGEDGLLLLQDEIYGTIG